MFFKNRCVLVLRTKVAPALEGLKGKCTIRMIMVQNELIHVPFQIRPPPNLSPRAVRYYLAEIPNFPSSCPSLVYLADMYGIYKLNVPLLIKKTSFEVKHCKLETVLISRSAEAAKLRKSYI